MADDYNPNDFEWRFQQTLKEHREKLDALPPERRKGVEEGLRRRFEENAKDFYALSDNSEKYDFFEGLEALIDKEERETAEHVDRAQEAWDRMQQERGRDQGQEKEPER
jgi:hypothetical protein